jgi:hypothetical protein
MARSCASAEERASAAFLDACPAFLMSYENVFNLARAMWSDMNDQKEGPNDALLK